MTQGEEERRDVVFLVADGGMQQMLDGYLGREYAHRGLGCASFDFDPLEDIVVAPRCDPEVYGHHRGLLSFYQETHRRAIVMIDEKWEGSPGADAITAHIELGMAKDWEAGSFAVIVLKPELESWLWQENNPNIARELRIPSDYRQILEKTGHWPTDSRKPVLPKKALEHMKKHHGADQSNAAFRRLTASISVKGCVDPAFTLLRDTLCAWFPETTYS
ncbi:hypothetical protein AB0N16_25270 [Streptomyces sp. NPDC051105]|uniref:methylation-associated defense system protein MAD4 n=1 Tax=Streptomyces sp. NPDC051105 TaxID=3154843 RepID=UPI00341B8A8A